MPKTMQNYMSVQSGFRRKRGLKPWEYKRTDQEKKSVGRPITNYYCKTCNFRGPSHQALAIHVNNNHDTKPLECYLCYRSKKGKACAEHAPKKPRAIMDARSKKVWSGLRKVKDKTYRPPKPKKKKKKKFVETVESEVCEVCDAPFNSKLELKKHKKIHEDAAAKFRCSECYRWFKTAEALERHCTRVHVDGPVECDYCNKFFNTKKRLITHMAIHTRPHVCDICGATRRSESTLKLHIKLHNKDYSHFCKECNKGFYNQATLKIHEIVHTDYRPFMCEICGSSYRSATYLREHIKIHNDPSERKRYQCEFCDFESFHAKSIKQHLWTHTRENHVPCTICGKVLTSHYMPIHMLTHTGEKPHACRFCGKTFRAKKNVVSHERIHTGEKPYPCTQCDKSFALKDTLKVHMRRHEAELNRANNAFTSQ